jgi:hypothetical protein
MKLLSQLLMVLMIAVLDYPQRALGLEADLVYYSEHGGFYFWLPLTWVTREQDMGQGVWGVFAQSPKEGSSDAFSENVNVMVVPADTTNLSEANRRGIEVAKRSLRQFTILDQAVGKVGPYSASWFVGSYSYEGNTIKQIKYTLINGSRMYLVTGTALSETFGQSRPVFERIVASIKFSDEPAPPPANNLAVGIAVIILCLVLVFGVPQFVKWLAARNKPNLSKDGVGAGKGREAITTYESGKEPKASAGPAKPSLGDIITGIGLLALGGGILESMLGDHRPGEGAILGYLMIGGLIVAGIGRWLDRSRNK